MTEAVQTDTPSLDDQIWDHIDFLRDRADRFCCAFEDDVEIFAAVELQNGVLDLLELDLADCASLADATPAEIEDIMMRTRQLRIAVDAVAQRVDAAMAREQTSTEH